jgi:hypothetical protein
MSLSDGNEGTMHVVPSSVRVPTAERAEVRCPRDGCRRVMGETDGSRLYLVTCTVTRLVTLYCLEPGCDGKWTWTPVKSC